jgi:hypothetical protein
MAFGNNRQQNNRTNTTTKVIQMYNPVGDDAGTLTLGYWNTFATVKINPILPEKQREDGKMYNYDVTGSVLLNPETVIALEYGITKLESLIKNKKNAPAVAVRAGNYVVKVGQSSDYDGMEGDFYVGLFEVDNKGVATGSMFYPFAVQKATENTLMFGWDEDTAKHKAVTYNTQWEAFKTFLRQAKADLISGGAHGTTHQVNIWLTRLTNALDVVKGMIETASFGGGRGGNSGGDKGGQSGFGGGGFAGRRKRNINTGGNDDGGNSGGGKSRGNSGGSRNKTKEEPIDDISDIENEMMDEVGDIDEM